MESIVGTIIVLLTALITYKGLRDQYYLERYDFYVDGILIDRQFDRILSSGFLHVGWLHFGFNMGSLLAFSWTLEILFGYGMFALLYLVSLLGGSLLALYIHRNHGDYRAVGASGAVSGIVFSSIVLFPDVPLSIFFLPPIPSWVLGILFIVVSILGIRSQRDNIGHEAHLGGAIIGVVFTVLTHWEIVRYNWWIVLLVLIPTSVFLILIVRNPAVLMVDDYWGETVHDMKHTMPFTKREKSRAEKEMELNQLLEKIRTKGIKSLTPKERNRLDELSKMGDDGGL